MIALKARSVTTVVKSGIFLATALVSRTVFAISKLYIAALSNQLLILSNFCNRCKQPGHVMAACPEGQA